jgi:hypothetical protein
MKMSDPTPRLMRVKQFIAFSGLSRSRIYRLAKSGDIKLVRLGASTYVDVPTAMAYLDGLPDYRDAKTGFWGTHNKPPRSRKK